MISKSRVKSTELDKNNLVLLAEVKSEEKFQIASIECIVAENIFTNVFFNNNNIIQVRKSLNEWENILPRNVFIRINRGVIVNLAHVKLIEKTTHQTMVIHMHHYDKPLTMSRNYASKLKKELFL